VCSSDLPPKTHALARAPAPPTPTRIKTGHTGHIGKQATTYLRCGKKLAKPASRKRYIPQNQRIVRGANGSDLGAVIALECPSLRPSAWGLREALSAAVRPGTGKRPTLPPSTWRSSWAAAAANKIRVSALAGRRRAGKPAWAASQCSTDCGGRVADSFKIPSFKPSRFAKSTGRAGIFRRRRRSHPHTP